MPQLNSVMEFVVDVVKSFVALGGLTAMWANVLGTFSVQKHRSRVPGMIFLVDMRKVPSLRRSEEHPSKCPRNLLSHSEEYPKEDQINVRHARQSCGPLMKSRVITKDNHESPTATSKAKEGLTCRRCHTHLDRRNALLNHLKETGHSNWCENYSICFDFSHRWSEEVARKKRYHRKEIGGTS